MLGAVIRPLLWLVIGLLITVYTALVIRSGVDLALVFDHFYLFFIGIFAATIANSTGMGGGVVFLPAFEYVNSPALALSAAQIIGMSFVIQSFGMTTGSARWLHKAYISKTPQTGVTEKDFWRIIAVVLLTALPSLLITQYALHLDKDLVLLVFKLFSILLGLKLLAATLFTQKSSAGVKEGRTDLAALDINMLLLAGAFGGVATALFSVGVGEFVALYLFIRNFPLVTCAASAVILSALTILVGLPWHLMHTDLPWNLLALIIPGAVIGGTVARAFAYKLGTRNLKYFAGLWIIGSSLFLLLR